MDFSTIKTKMRNREYRNFTEFKQDVLVVFSNCMSFNSEDSDLYVAAYRL